MSFMEIPVLTYEVLEKKTVKRLGYATYIDKDCNMYELLTGFRYDCVRKSIVEGEIIYKIYLSDFYRNIDDNFIPRMKPSEPVTYKWRDYSYVGVYHMMADEEKNLWVFHKVSLKDKEEFFSILKISPGGKFLETYKIQKLHTADGSSISTSSFVVDTKLENAFNRYGNEFFIIPLETKSKVKTSFLEPDKKWESELSDVYVVLYDVQKREAYLSPGSPLLITLPSIKVISFGVMGDDGYFYFFPHAKPVYILKWDITKKVYYLFDIGKERGRVESQPCFVPGSEMFFLKVHKLYGNFLEVWSGNKFSNFFLDILCSDSPIFINAQLWFDVDSNLCVCTPPTQIQKESYFYRLKLNFDEIRENLKEARVYEKHF